MHYPGHEAQDEDSSDSEADEQSIIQDPKETPSQPSSTSHRPRAASCRATAVWCTDSGSDDSRRWSDQLSLDEKDGFIFVNYSEGQTRAHLQGPLSHPHLSPIEVRNYSRLKPGNLKSGVYFLLLWMEGWRRWTLALPMPIPVTWTTHREGLLSFLLCEVDLKILSHNGLCNMWGIFKRETSQTRNFIFIHKS